MIQETEQQAAYLQLYKGLRDAIISGVYTYGEKLPSKRILAQEQGISLVTVEHALSLLADEGYIRCVQRSGNFVEFRLTDGFAAMPSAARGLPVHVHDPERSADLPFPVSVLTKTMRRVLSEQQEEILAHSPGQGRTELRQAICAYLRRSRGIQVHPHQVVIGCGSEYLYGLILHILGMDRIYGLESPSYKKIRQVYALNGVQYRMLPLSEDGIAPLALAQTDAEVLHITPYRSFPSGVTASATKRHAYLQWAQRPGRWIIEDDYESEFSVSRKPEETLFAHSGQENVLYLNTFSKTISPSLRVGYLVLPPSLVDVYTDRVGFYACPVPTFVQLVLAQLLLDGDFERQINRVRRRKRRELAAETQQNTEENASAETDA